MPLSVFAIAAGAAIITSLNATGSSVAISGIDSGELVVQSDNTTHQGFYFEFGQLPTPTETQTPPPVSTGLCGTPDYASRTGTKLRPVSNEAELTSALSSANPGDVIQLKPGNYSNGNTFTVTRSGTADKPIVITSASSTAVIGGNFTKYGLYINGVSNIIVDNLEIKNVFRGIQNNSVKNVTLRNLKVHRANTSGIEVNKGTENDNIYSDGVLIECNTIHDLGLDEDHNAEGIYIGSGWSRIPLDRERNVTIRYNEIYNTPAEGIEVKPYTENITVNNNYVHDIKFLSDTNSGAIAIDVSRNGNGGDPPNKGDTKIVVKNNVIWNISEKSNPLYDNVANGIRTGGPATIENNILWNITDSPIQVSDLFKKSGWFSDVVVKNNTAWDSRNPAFTTNGGVLKIKSSGNLGTGYANWPKGSGDVDANSSNFTGPLSGSYDSGDGPGSALTAKSTSSGADLSKIERW